MTQEVHGLIESALAKGFRVIVIEPPVSEGAWAFAQSDTGTGDEAGPAGPTEQDPLLIIARYREEGGEPLTPKTWVDLLEGAISERELNRAIAADVIAAQPKRFGRDHRGLGIAAAEMEAYMAHCQSVQSGVLPTPVWWHNVRKGPNAEIV